MKNPNKKKIKNRNKQIKTIIKLNKIIIHYKIMIIKQNKIIIHYKIMIIKLNKIIIHYKIMIIK